MGEAPSRAALGFSLAVILLLPGMRTLANPFLEGALPVTWGGVLSHVLLVHNARPEWFIKIDGPMWTIAIEWQIYFVFPLLLMVWRRWGLVASAVAGVAAGQAVHHAAHGRLDYSQPFFIGHFAFGMSAAAMLHARTERASAALLAVPWATVGVVMLSLGLAVGSALPRWSEGHGWFIHIFVAAATAAMLLHCGRDATERASAREPSILRRALESRAVSGVGRFSYSLYLFHMPVLAAVAYGLRGVSMAAPGRSLLNAAVGVPVALGAAYGFFLLVERRFLKGPGGARAGGSHAGAGCLTAVGA